MRFFLHIVLTDGGPELEGEVDESRFRVGRSPDCDLVLPPTAEMVSAYHAEFRVQGGTLCVQDTDSRNGTFVDGERITTWTPLPRASTVRLGRNGPTVHWRLLADDGQQAEADARHVSTRARQLRRWLGEHRQLVLGVMFGAGIVLLAGTLLLWLRS